MKKKQNSISCRCESEVDTIFTRVSSYLDWIEEHVCPGDVLVSLGEISVIFMNNKWLSLRNVYNLKMTFAIMLFVCLLINMYKSFNLVDLLISNIFTVLFNICCFAIAQSYKSYKISFKSIYQPWCKWLSGQGTYYFIFNM